MEKITFNASKHKITEDSDGEVTLTLKIPQMDAQKALKIPVHVAFVVNIDLE